MTLTARGCGLLITAFIVPPVAVLVSKDAFDTDFWLNLLLTLLAWLPGSLHAIYIVTREDAQWADRAYIPLPPTMPPPPPAKPSTSYGVPV